MISVVIVNWNTGCLLRECVESVIQYGKEQVEQIIVVDNGSTDGSELYIDGLPKVQLIRAGENLGFGKACNLGASYCSSPYFLFLNPDARLMAGALETSIAFLNSDDASDVGILGVRLVDEKGDTQRHCARFPTWRTYLGQALALTKILPRVFPPHFMRDFDHLSSCLVDQVIGAFFLVRKDIFHSLNGFDERFFVYFEELDFALRAREMGLKTYYLADALSFHKGGGASEQVKAHRLFYSLRSRILYAFKHFDFFSAVLVFFTTLCVEPFSRVVRAILNRSFLEVGDTVRGFRMLWSDLPNIIRTVRCGHG